MVVAWQCHGYLPYVLHMTSIFVVIYNTLCTWLPDWSSFTYCTRLSSPDFHICCYLQYLLHFDFQICWCLQHFLHMTSIFVDIYFLRLTSRFAAILKTFQTRQSLKKVEKGSSRGGGEHIYLYTNTHTHTRAHTQAWKAPSSTAAPALRSTTAAPALKPTQGPAQVRRNVLCSLFVCSFFCLFLFVQVSFYVLCYLFICCFCVFCCAGPSLMRIDGGDFMGYTTSITRAKLLL